MKIALLQINPTVGDLAGNARLILDAAREAGARGRRPGRHARTGARRLPAARPAAVRRVRGEQLGPPRALAATLADAAGAGRPARTESVRRRAAALQHRGAAARRSRRAAFRKALLPTYDVFDEDRYFEPFHGAQMLDIGGRRLGISICEDIWNDRDFWKRRRYHHDPIEELVRAGAEAIVNLSASPFTVGKHARREEMLGSMARQAPRAGRLRQSVRRQRRSGVRRPQLRIQRRRRSRSRAADRSNATW